VAQEKRSQREHRPQDLGPRIEQRGRYWTADLRPWGGSRYTSLRDPTHARWPAAGERTEDEDIARRWGWKYVDLTLTEKRNRLLGVRKIGEPVADAAQRFVDERQLAVERGLLEQNTAKTQRTAIHHLTEHVASSQTVSGVDTAALQVLFDELLDGKYAASTLQSYRASLITFFEWAGRGGSDNPARTLVIPEIADKDAHAWSDEEIERLRKSADSIGGHARLALEVGLNTGTREQELFALDWSHFNFASRTVRVQRQLVHYSEEFKGLKGKRARTALVLPDFEPLYREGRGLVVARPDGRPIGTQPQRRLMEAILDGAQLSHPGVRWHALRHTYARLFIEMGGRFEELQKSLGHSSIAVTEGTYGHFHEDRAAAAARERIYQHRSIRVVA
jgi:site-specific recombinase XerD